MAESQEFKTIQPTDTTDNYRTAINQNALKTIEELGNKVDKVAGKGLSSNDYTTTEKTKLENLINYDDTSVKQSITQVASGVDALQASKVDKISGKGLSSNDYTTVEKAKLADIADNANNYRHPSSHEADMIEESVSKRFVSDAEKAVWGGKANSDHTHSDKADVSSIVSFNGTATLAGNVVAITVASGSKTSYTVTFTAPSNFVASNTYRINGVVVTLTDLNNKPLKNAWVQGSAVTLSVSGNKAFFKAGGEFSDNDLLPERRLKAVYDFTKPTVVDVYISNPNNNADPMPMQYCTYENLQAICMRSQWSGNAGNWFRSEISISPFTGTIGRSSVDPVGIYTVSPTTYCRAGANSKSVEVAQFDTKKTVSYFNTATNNQGMAYKDGFYYFLQDYYKITKTANDGSIVITTTLASESFGYSDFYNNYSRSVYLSNNHMLIFTRVGATHYLLKLSLADLSIVSRIDLTANGIGVNVFINYTATAKTTPNFNYNELTNEFYFVKLSATGDNIILTKINGDTFDITTHSLGSYPCSDNTRVHRIGVFGTTLFVLFGDGHMRIYDDLTLVHSFDVYTPKLTTDIRLFGNNFYYHNGQIFISVPTFDPKYNSYSGNTPKGIYFPISDYKLLEEKI